MESQGRHSGTRFWACVVAAALVAIPLLAVRAFAQLPPVQPPPLPVGPTGPVGVPAPPAPPVPKLPAPKLPAPAPKPAAPKPPTPKLPAPSVTVPKPAKPAPKAPAPKAPAAKSPAPKLPSLPALGGSGSGSSSAPATVRLPGGGSVSVPSLSGGGSSGGGSGGGVGGIVTPLVGGTAQAVARGGGGTTSLTGGPAFGGAAGGFPVAGGPGGPATGGGGAFASGGGVGGGPGGGSFAGPGGPLAGPGSAAAILLQAERALDPNIANALTGGISPEMVQAAIVSLSGCLTAITMLERSVLTLRYGLDGGAFRSPAQVGRAIGTSRRGALRLEQRALRNLRVAATSTNCGAFASASGLPVAFDPSTIPLVAANPFGGTPSDDGLAGGGPVRLATASPIWAGAGHGDIGWLLLAIAVLGGSLLAGGVLAHAYQRGAPPGPAPRPVRHEAPRRPRPASARPRPASARRAAAHARRRAGSRRQSVRFRRHGQAPDDG